MNSAWKRSALTALPIVVSSALILTACGGGASTSSSAVAQAPASSAAAPAPAPIAAQARAAGTGATASVIKSTAAAPVVKTKTAKSPARAAKAAPAQRAVSSSPEAQRTVGGLRAIDSTAQAADNAGIAEAKGGVTDIGVDKGQIKLGIVTSHGLALANLLMTPFLNGVRGTVMAINDRGGILGRRMVMIDCDDGTGEVSRSKACVKKMVVQDKIFSLLGYMSWGTASIHDDLAQNHLPLVGTWAYSQTEWQDPYMFPTHMSMIHEAMAGAHWAADVIHPKTYGLVCLTSPEMQLACNEVRKIMDASGSTLVKRADLSISETSMSAYILAFRAANPDHIIHYVINPATMAKFMVEAAQQGYYPPLGISGNHLAAEVLGALIGKWPVGRYWTNTTYKLWGPEFMAIMAKYARGNLGLNHHIVQAGYFGALEFERAAKAVGPNLTRLRLMAQLDNGDVYAMDSSLDQRFAYTPTERAGNNWSHDWGQNREFMYEYTSTNTVANPDGSASGLTPDSRQFVIYAK
jgi:ABC-type branched-subunit amino acid transport system substrate-binding protein